MIVVRYRRVVALAVLSLAAALIVPAFANAGQFTVASCQGDTSSFSTTAFTDFATRGMNIKRACNPEGPGVRGLVTGNTLRATALPRGSVAMAAITAPPGTTFTTLQWAGSIRRGDCRYALQLYAEVPGAAAVSIKNVRANRGCARDAHGQAAGYKSADYNIGGATRIVQRVVCMGGNGRRSCSGRKLNYVRTYKAVVGVVDTQAPTAAIAADTPLATGDWVGGTQPLNYTAEDNVGIRMAAISPNTAGGTDQRPCAVATASGAFSTPTPCPNGPGQLQVKTNVLPEGTQQLAVQAQDTAGNLGTSPPITARIDNTPPGRVDVTVQGGEQWRNTNDFVAAWTNPAEDDRAPIVSVTSKLCAADGTRCTQGDTAGDGIASLPVEVPGPGEWTVSLWRHDAAGNVDQTAASVPVTLRYDPEPPQLSFDTPSQGDPTLLSVPVVDKVSGVADGSIEISAAGSDTWQTLKTDIDGDHLVARVDDAALPAGPYAVRATAHDHAGNEASTSQRTDGQPMTLTLPIRIVSAASAGVLGVRIERTVIKKKHGRRSVKVTRVPELKPTDSVRLGQQAQVIGRLCNRDGQGIANATLDVLETSALAPEHLIGQVSTDANGGFSYTATGTTSRTLHFVYGGSAVVLPSDARVELTTPAESTLGVDRARVLNGQSVTFSGHVASGPIPAGGKLVQLEVRLSHRWQTFRTVRTDAAGNWAVPYRFARTRGIAWYRFRVELPPEAGYPFTAGASKSIRVRVRGRR